MSRLKLNFMLFTRDTYKYNYTRKVESTKMEKDMPSKLKPAGITILT